MGTLIGLVIIFFGAGAYFSNDGNGCLGDLLVGIGSIIGFIAMIIISIAILSCL